MGRISRGWALTKQSWAVLQRDRSLLVFPVLATIFAIIAVVTIWAPTLVLEGVFQGGSASQHDPLFYIAGWLTAYASTFIAIFFNVALTACAARSMRGEDTKVSDGINAAMQRIGPIAGWTVLTTTVGLILRALEERLPFAGWIAARLAGATWAIATFFVVPVIALEGGGPVRSLKRSATVVKDRWGEGATGAAAIGLASVIASLAIIAAGMAGAIAFAALDLMALVIVVIAVAVVGLVVVGVVSSALGQIFRLAVYQYAVTGGTPSGFDGGLLQAAFKQRGGAQPTFS